MSSVGPFDDFRQYLPRYLSEGDLRKLLDDLSRYPDIAGDKMYSHSLRDAQYVCQGDGIRDMLVVELPDTSVRSAPCMVISNTCDMSPDNKRPLPMRAAYAPIIRLAKLKDKMEAEKAASYLANVRRQRVSNVFYLPLGGDLDYEGMVMLDRLNNCGLSDINNDRLSQRRLFTLSNYGFYIFVFKLSIHFTRIREQVARG